MQYLQNQVCRECVALVLTHKAAAIDGEEGSTHTPSWVGQLSRHVRSLFNVSTGDRKRRRDYEEDVMAQMLNYYRESLPHVQHPPIMPCSMYTLVRELHGANMVYRGMVLGATTTWFQVYIPVLK